MKWVGDLDMEKKTFLDTIHIGFFFVFFLKRKIFTNDLN